MAIQYIILGYLSTGNMTGYDLKKAIAAHPLLPWSGNNNQIYKSLKELENQGAIESETVIQYQAPNKRLYKITNPGRAILKHWLYEDVKPAQSELPLLVKLQFADHLKPKDWFEILIKFRQELFDRLVLYKNMPVPRLHTTKSHKPGPDDLAASSNKLALKYEITRLEAEILLVNQLLDLVKVQAGWKDPDSLPKDPLEQEMHTSIAYPLAGRIFEQLIVHRLDTAELPILELAKAGTVPGPVIATEQDAHELLTLCMEHQAQGILAPANLFHDDFFRLKTGLAGAILQKLANHQVRLALVRPPEQKIKGKFLEFIQESNHGSQFAVHDNREDAIRWLIH